MLTPIVIVNKCTIKGDITLPVMYNKNHEKKKENKYNIPTDKFTFFTQPIALQTVAIGLSAHDINEERTTMRQNMEV